MMPDLTLSGDEPIQFHLSPLRKFRGARLPGSEYWQAGLKQFAAHFQEYEQNNYSISYRIFETLTEHSSFNVKEKEPSLRIEIVLEGTLIVRGPLYHYRIPAGEYHITQGAVSNLSLEPNNVVRYIVASINKNNIEQGALLDQPLHSPRQMTDLITELLFNRYQLSLLSFYYENCIRELFFLHAACQLSAKEEKLSANELAAIHQADKIIRENLHTHFSIQELSRKTGTNEFKLKKDFRTVFKTGLFGRLLQLRMEHARHLLQTTSLAIKDIGEQAGYDTVAGFITAFKKYYGTPPGEWRQHNDQNGSHPASE